MTSQQIGEFELNRPGMCKNCPHMDLNVDVSRLYFEDKAIILTNCSHRDICKRAYDMGVKETPIEVSPKTGHWEPFDLTYDCDIYKCSVCKCATNVPTVLEIPMFKYCPNCGAKMVESQDSESKRYMELAKFYAYELRRAGLAESEA